MPSIDTLLGLTVAELEAMTDEDLLRVYADCFNLEPQVPIQATPLEEVEDEDQPKQPRKSKATTTTKPKSKMDLLKEQILKESQEDFFKL